MGKFINGKIFHTCSPDSRERSGAQLACRCCIVQLFSSEGNYKGVEESCAQR